jgi:hypothetical protein
MRASGRVEFKVSNKSLDTISRLSIRLCHQEFAARDLKPGDEVSTVFKTGKDCQYRIAAEFLSGKILKQDKGHVTRGLSYEDSLDILDSDMYLKSEAVAH